MSLAVTRFANTNYVGLGPFTDNTKENRIKRHSKLEALLRNIIYTLFKTNGTVNVKDKHGHTHRLNREKVIKWIGRHHPSIDLKKKDCRALIALLEAICNKKPSKSDKDEDPKPLPDPTPKTPEQIIFDQTHELAHKNNDAGAQAKLSKLYLLGEGTEESRPLAIKYAKKSADQGHRKGQFLLGNLYLSEPNCTQSQTKEGFDLIQKSADQGYAPAQLTVGTVYHKGLCQKPRNQDEAYKWVKKSAEQEHEPAYELAGLLALRSTSKTVAEVEAFLWYFKAAHRADPTPESMRVLGILYKDGRGIGQSDDEAYKWLLKAAEANDQHAQYLVAQMLFTQGTPASIKEGFDWCVKSMNQGYFYAKVDVGVILYEKGEPESCQKGLQVLFDAWKTATPAQKDYVNKQLEIRNIDFNTIYPQVA